MPAPASCKGQRGVLSKGSGTVLGFDSRRLPAISALIGSVIICGCIQYRPAQARHKHMNEAYPQASLLASQNRGRYGA